MNFIIGVDDFGKVIQEEFNFIDKSLFIKEILDNAGTEVTVITRPRRFGKTLNMSMLHYFLTPEIGGRTTAGMFDQLKIAQCGSAYMNHQGKYPVIFISFKSVSGGSFAQACEQLRTLLQKVYREHSYLLDSTKLRVEEKKAYEAILNREVPNLALLETALEELSRLLYVHHGIKPWILIDEYDTPIQSAYFNNYYDDMIKFMRSVLGNALKGNPNLHRAVVTGILRISKESLFSELNNLDVLSILNSKYATCFGFTQTEVDEALQKFHIGHLSTEIKQWYNGYHIGNHQIYNPWSIANCIDKEGEMRPYWVNTGRNDLIKSSIAAAGPLVKEQVERLLVDEVVEQTINEHMIFGDLKTNSDALWSLLLFSGYLTAIKKMPVDTRVRCILQAPNQEVVALYRDVIRDWFSDCLDEVTYHALLENLITGQLESFLEKLKQFLEQSSSYFDIKGHHPENFYHGFVLGLIVSLADTHSVQSNRESGDGRYDVMLIPKDTQQLGLILEFKIARKDATLAGAAKEALAQINSRGYETELRQKGIQKIVKIGLAFRDKDVEMAVSS